MGNGLTRGRHRKGELPISTTENIPLQERNSPLQVRLPLHERIRQLPKHPSSLQLELPVPEFLYSEPPSACQSLNNLDQDFRLNGLNGDIGLSNNLLCVPGSLQEVNADFHRIWLFREKRKFSTINFIASRFLFGSLMAATY